MKFDANILKYTKINEASNTWGVMRQSLTYMGTILLMIVQLPHPFTPRIYANPGFCIQGTREQCWKCTEKEQQNEYLNQGRQHIY